MDLVSVSCDFKCIAKAHALLHSFSVLIKDRISTCVPITTQVY